MFTHDETDYYLQKSVAIPKLVNCYYMLRSATGAREHVEKSLKSKFTYIEHTWFYPIDDYKQFKKKLIRV